MLRFIDKFQWRGTEYIYSLPWLRNRMEYSADPSRIKDYFRGGKFTRSQMTRDMLSRFHLSHNSIVVSDDDHAQFLRKLFREHSPAKNQYELMAKTLVDNLFAKEGNVSKQQQVNISKDLIPEVYLCLLSNMLGVQILKPLEKHIRNTAFEPGTRRTRPMIFEGVMYSFGMLLPGFKPMRSVIDLLFFRGNHYTRKIAQDLETHVFDYALPKVGSWYQTLLDLKQSGEISNNQFKGEVTSMLVSSYTLSAALSSMLLCLAARPEYVKKIQNDKSMADHFVNEVLRLYPPFRQFGYEKKGIWDRKDRDKKEVTDFMVSVYVLHRNEQVWDDAEEFRPERFQVSGVTRGCKFMPFGVGKRSCSGRAYSLAILSQTLKYIASENSGFKLSLPEDFESDCTGLPVGTAGRLVSFPIDDRLIVQRHLNKLAQAYAS
ncbi:MAG: cytochrome P450 [Arenicella sp.]|jgi:cytochrome P450